MTAAQLLKNAKALIQSRDNWTTWALARSSSGYEVQPKASDAVKWCAMGALRHENPELGSPMYDGAYDFLNNASWQLFQDSITDVNDGKGHNAVLMVYERAIKLAEQI